MSPEASRGAWDEYALVGRIARAHGNRGQVIVNPETDFVEQRFQVGAVLHTWREGRMETLRVTAFRLHLGRPIIALTGVETMDDAEAMAGLELRVPVEELAPLPEGMFYRHDLVGCEVETTTGERVGSVAAVQGEASASRLVVRGPSDDEVLIPLAAEICVRIDPAARRIVVDPPQGLLDVNRRP
ncbi:MAG TPA: ribosome maturation factor RimM [Vicinamibacterales bacterium]|nr:ribosome maturation factor RimM [Vicinamibacterales bacterium]